MTLTARNIIIKSGIIFASLVVLFTVLVSFVLIPVYSSFDIESFCRPAGFFQKITAPFLQPNFYAVHFSIIALAVFSLVALCLLHHFFKNIQLPEISFIAVFVMSLSLEPVRFILPLSQVFDFSPIFLIFASRCLLFGRYAGLFSLFASSIYSAGLDARNQKNFMFIVVITAFIIAVGIPLDTFTRETAFNAASSFNSVFRVLNGIIVFTTITGFIISAYVRSSREYIFAGIGVLLVFAARNMLITSDNWAGLPGVLVLAFGVWFTCTHLHKINHRL